MGANLQGKDVFYLVSVRAWDQVLESWGGFFVNHRKTDSHHFHEWSEVGLKSHTKVFGSWPAPDVIFLLVIGNKFCAFSRMTIDLSQNFLRPSPFARSSDPKGWGQTKIFYFQEKNRLFWHFLCCWEVLWWKRTNSRIYFTLFQIFLPHKMQFWTKNTHFWQIFSFFGKNFRFFKKSGLFRQFSRYL